MSFRALIVDDEPPAREKLAYFLKSESDFDVVGEAGNGVEALEQIELLKPDVVFLDIQMPELDGISVAANLEDCDDLKIVFVTGFNEFAIQAFELNAVDYLLKPYDRERLQKSLQRLRRRQSQNRPTLDKLISDYRSGEVYAEQLMFKTEADIRVINSADIQWAEASGNYVKICTRQTAFIARQTLVNFQSQLDPKSFVRIHRSHLVNVASVVQLSSLSKGDFELLLTDGTRLRLSRSYKDDFFALFDAPAP